MKVTTIPKRLGACFLCVVLCLSLLPISAMAAGTQEVLTITVNNGSAEDAYTQSGNTITVNEGADVTISGTTTTDHIVVQGDASITLNNVNIQFDLGQGEKPYDQPTDSNAGTCALWINGGASLNLTLSGDNTLQSGAGRAGINVSESATLTIQGDGTLNVTGGSGAAGIGGGTWNNAGTIIINGGTINATGTDDGAGIGGGHANDKCDQIYGGFASITINGGTVTARATRNAAGIGTGCWSKKAGSITIKNAIVSASTDGNHDDCAAIGQGVHSASAGVVSISITDSIITAINRNGAQISTGGDGPSISNAIVAQGVQSADNYEVYGNCTLPGDFTIGEGQILTIVAEETLNLGRHTLTNNGTIVNYGTVSGSSGCIVNNGALYSNNTISTTVTGQAVISLRTGASAYLDENGSQQTSPETTSTVVPVINTWGSNGNDEYWYIVSGDVTIDSRVTVNGDVHLILADGCNLTVNGGIGLNGNNSNITIYAQSTGDAMGALTAVANGSSDAGIGGDEDEPAGAITIHGGRITAEGYGYGAGIGSGDYESSCESITITGGKVTATGGFDGGAGIGCGDYGDCGPITITGGSVTAVSNCGAGIGSGIGDSEYDLSACGAIIISDGSVVAVGGYDGSGIGEAGTNGSCESITISGGSVIAFAGSDVDAITDGYIGDGNVITVDGTGTVFHGADSTVTLAADTTIPAGSTLVIPVGSTLVVPEGITLTADLVIVQGTLDNNGAVFGDTLDLDDLEGEGTADSPYLIPDLATLKYYRNLINAEDTNEKYGNAYYKLTADIDMNPGWTYAYDRASGDWTWTGNGQSLAQWVPIGTSDNEFNGNFDGNGHSIFDLYINRYEDDQGLFGYVEETGTVRNLSVTGDITGDDNIGGVVGESYGTVTGCSFAGSVTGDEDIGGIVGDNNGDVTGCTNNGSVTGESDDVGGIVGYNDGDVTVCANNGSVTGHDDDVGGIVGDNEDGRNIVNCYNTGNITGNDSDVGGIVGENWSIVANCYNTGSVAGSSNVGGIVGNNDSENHVTNCYYLADSETDALDGTTAKTTAQFASGQVAWLLQDWCNENVLDDELGQVWGQILTGDTRDASPILTSETAKSVVRVEFQKKDDEVIHTDYTNPGDTVGFPDLSGETDIPAGQTYAWFDGSGTRYYSYSTFAGDITLTAGSQFAYIAPQGVQGGANQITGVDSTMEYSADGGATWNEITGTAVTGLEPGDYQVRVKASGDVLASESVTVTVTAPNIPPANPNYRITVEATQGGTVAVNPTAAKEGTTVTITPDPDAGYQVGTVGVTDRSGEAVAVTENTDGTYTFVMPDGQVTVTVTFVEAGEPAAEPFTDVSDTDWFYDAVVYAYENGLMDGVGDNHFAPNTTTTRAQVVTILYRLAGEPAVSGELPFTDVEAGAWYTEAILWAAQNGIVDGVSATEFAPGDEITRQQLAAILYRYAGSQGYDVSASGDLSGYPDAGTIQAYAQEAMSWAVGAELLQGFEDNTLRPAGDSTRAQIATVLMRFCQTVAE